VTLGWLALAYRTAPAGAPLWPVGDGLWGVASAVMVLASILLMGSLVGNPALPNPGASAAVPTAARGVYAVTRHPMMWAFALWGLCHIVVYPVTVNIILASAIIILALVGAALQDRKKEALQPDSWPDWERRTSYWPFAAIVSGRARLGAFGAYAITGGVVLWLAATWAHLPLAGFPRASGAGSSSDLAGWDALTLGGVPSCTAYRSIYRPRRDAKRRGRGD
jgi:uncharacterized membrane protein